MAKMKSLVFDDGYESFAVNGDLTRVIRFNPADPEILNRLLDVRKKFQNYQVPENIELNPDGSPKSDLEVDAAYVAEFSNAMRMAFDGIFNSEVYDTIFNGQSPLCIVKGRYLFERVMEGLFNIMSPALEAYNKENQKKMGKYLSDLS